MYYVEVQIALVVQTCTQNDTKSSNNNCSRLICYSGEYEGRKNEEFAIH